MDRAQVEPPAGGWMTVKQAAAYTGYKEGTIRQKVFHGQIPYHKIGPKAIRFLRPEIDEWMRQQEEQAKAGKAADPQAAVAEANALSFGKWLKELRHRHNLGLSAFASRCGISRTRLSALECDRGGPPSEAELGRLAEIADEPVSSLKEHVEVATLIERLARVHPGAATAAAFAYRRQRRG